VSIGKIIGLLGVLTVCAFSGAAAAAYTLTSDVGRFTIELPDKPEFAVRRLRRESDGAILESNEWMVKQPWIFWFVSYRDHPEDDDASTAEKIYGRIIRELAAALEGELRAHRYVEHDGIRGLELFIYVPRNRLLMRSRVFVVGRRQYTISYVGEEGTEKQRRVESYLNSFHILP
jgi:hypothetical protein